MSIRRKIELIGIFLSSVVVTTAVLAASGQSTLPEGLSSDDWAEIQHQIQAQHFHAQADEQSDGWQAVNPSHGFTIQYHPNGQTQLTLVGAASELDRIALQLEGYGYGDRLNELNTAPELSANGNTVTYQWKPGLREWWVNNERGVEQWFELAQPPAVKHNGEPLVVAMTLTSDLKSEVRNSVLTLTSEDGASNITYDRLKVWDATGRVLPAEMQLRDDRLALLVNDDQAVYPVTIDPTFAQQAYLKASNTDASDSFGSALAISGDTVVVGASFESSNATGINGNEADNSAFAAGAAYVFVRDGTGVWSQQAYLKASNAEAFDSFGQAVAIDGDTIVVTANQESSNATGVGGDQNNNDLSLSGAAYVFVRDGGGIWSQQAYLKASNPNERDRWGTAVAISGDTIVVTSNAEDSGANGIDGNQGDNSARDTGAAYVFVRDGGGLWSQQAYIKASNAGCNDLFGGAAALDGNTLVIGALNEGNTAPCDALNAPPGSGAAYVFVRDGGGNWSEQAFLKAANPDPRDFFGSAVSVDGDTAVVGAFLEESNATGVNGDETDNSQQSAGAAYVFTRDGAGVWARQAYLKPSGPPGRYSFGFSVALSGDNLFVGAPGPASSGGAVFPFMRDGGGVWTPQPLLQGSNTEESDGFGGEVAISGTTLAVGARGESSNARGVDGNQNDNSASRAGAVYMFDFAYFIGGTVSGLSGNGLTLQNNGSNDLLIDSDGSFTFSTPLDDGADYTVTIDSQPTTPNQTCSVNNGSGTINTADVTNVEVVCVTDTFSIGGTVSGLNGTGLVLQNNGGDDLSITDNGNFTFATALNDDSNYVVTVATQPTGLSQTCTVTNGAGTLNGADVTDVQITCSTNQFTVGGTVSGLNGNGLVLQNNSGDDLAITGDGAFTLATALDDGSGYNVTVAAQPTNLSQTCSVSNGSGSLNSANVSNVEVTCVTNPFNVGGTVSGLNGDGLILQNNGGDDLAIADDGSFTFATALVDGSAYSVTVAAQPMNLSQTCSVSNGNGTLAGADVTNVQVSCVTDQFTVGGTVSGLNGTGLTLQNNGGDDLTIAADGAFTFATALDDGSDYDVTVLVQPSTARDQQCTISNGSGTLAGANVTDVVVSCLDITLSLSSNDQDFGLIFLGASGTGTITVTNTSSPDVTLESIGMPTDPFSITGGSCLSLPITLAAADTCTIEISFSPTEAGEFSDEIVITSNAVSSPDTVTIRGLALFEPLIVPTLNVWGLLALLLLMLGFGLSGLVLEQHIKTVK